MTKNDSVVKNLLIDIISEMTDEQIAKIIKEIFKLEFDDAERCDEKNKINYIALTKEIKQKYPRLKNISMIESVSGYDNWYDSMEYAKNLKRCGYNDWRLMTCSGKERVNDSTDEIYALYEAKEDLHNLAVKQCVEDDFLKDCWWWSGQEVEFDTDCAWHVSSSGGFGYGSKSYGGYRRRYVR